MRVPSGPRGGRTLARNLHLADRSAAPAAVHQAGLRFVSACRCQSSSPNKERWKRNYKEVPRSRVNRAVDLFSLNSLYQDPVNSKSKCCTRSLLEARAAERYGGVRLSVSRRHERVDGRSAELFDFIHCRHAGFYMIRNVTMKHPQTWIVSGHINALHRCR